MAACMFCGEQDADGEDLLCSGCQIDTAGLDNAERMSVLWGGAA